MSRRKPAKRKATPTARLTKPIEPTDQYARRAAMRAAVDSLGEPTSPSLQAAQRYETSGGHYTNVERKAAEHALDFNGAAANALTFVSRTGFPGFPTLALLSQLPEYRTMHETLADECVRKWGHVKAADNTPPAVLEQIESELKRINLREAARQLVIHDQAFGGGHVYFKLKNDEQFRDTPLVLRPFTVKKGSFEGLRVVEPYWVTPNYYNSIDPTAADFYKPSSWWMLGTEVHATRLETIISRPVPDMLKPTYSFRGISMTQLSAEYVDNWLRTRQSVSDTVKQFSITGVRTDMQQMLQPGGAMDLAARADLFNRARDNRNIAFLDMATEEFFQLNTPLSGLDALQAQSQEQMAAVSHTPLVKLLGVTPTGLNASSDGEVRVWYDYVAGYQANTLTALLQTTLRIVQLSLFGNIDESIFFEWAQLHELTELEDAERQKHEAETDAIYIEQQVITPQQVAERLDNDLGSMYSGTLVSDTLEETRDDDIQGITEHILQIGGAQPEQETIAPAATGGEGYTANAGPVDPAEVDPDSLAQLSGEGVGMLEPDNAQTLQ
jgi:phage-related protein (TIGR01555 family)